MGRKREEIDVLASHYYCRANWQGYTMEPHYFLRNILKEYFGGIFWRDITKGYFEGYFGGIFWWDILVGRKREEIDVLASHYYTILQD